jgi:hypothetical protein
MGETKVGTVRGRSGKVFEVWWDEDSTDFRVKDVGTLVVQVEGSDAPAGKAPSSAEAMRKAAALVADK